MIQRMTGKIKGDNLLLNSKQALCPQPPLRLQFPFLLTFLIKLTFF